MINMEYTCQQCELVNGSMRKISWIPSKFAVNNKKLYIDDPNGGREFWIVERVFNRIMSYSEVNERSQDYKHTREASEI